MDVRLTNGVVDTEVLRHTDSLRGGRKIETAACLDTPPGQHPSRDPTHLFRVALIQVDPLKSSPEEEGQQEGDHMIVT